MNLFRHTPSVVFFLLSFEAAAAGNTLPAPVFSNESEIFSRAGHVKLLWYIENTDEAEIEYELQRSLSASFDAPVTVYRGPDAGSFVSGLNNGIYYFRARAFSDAVSSAWSGTIKLTVEHHSLKTAFTLFGLGGAVFLLTLGMLLHGVRKTNRESS